MKLALDRISRPVVNALEALGFECPVRREHGERVESWIARAIASDVSVLVSPDRAVGKAAFQAGLYWIKVRGHKRGDDQVQPMLGALLRILQEEESR